MFYSYVLFSSSAGRYYHGSTAKLYDRLATHNKGKVKYTKPFRPWVIVFSEQHPTRSQAFKREQFYKSIEGYQFLKSIGIK